VLDLKREFRRTVVDFFVEGYEKGVTPNPCMECNRTIRWKYLLNHALKLGATHLATGHYARIEGHNAELALFKANDQEKDQSYVLSVLSQKQLQYAIFPLGELTKPEVRGIASDLDLPSSNRPESQDLCFVPEGDYRAFLDDYSGNPPDPGPILDEGGNKLGSHTGLSGYTIGQRKGIGISSSRALYVVRKDPGRNALIVGPESSLGCKKFTASRVNWISTVQPRDPFLADTQVRYRAPLVPAEVLPLESEDRMEVHLQQPVRDVTAGQAAVMYVGDRCLGSGIIDP
jgi:tRNA-specific 2-thiouridylase